MAQDENLNGSQAPKAYGVVGDEIASVLASARKASAEMRAQARQYADSLVDGARQEIAEIQAKAGDDARLITAVAQEEARRMLQDARREVLRIVESAQARVTEAEKAVQEAEARREMLLAMETEIEAGVTAVAAAVRDRVTRLREAREESLVSTPGDPAEDFARLLATSNAALAEDPSNQVSSGNGSSNGNGNGNH